jgi:hypothetical protein
MSMPDLFGEDRTVWSEGGSLQPVLRDGRRFCKDPQGRGGEITEDGGKKRDRLIVITVTIT